MTDYPRVTVVTPCFNHERYIARTIESVLSQQYPDLEYIVIDDGSTDRSGDIIREYKDDITQILTLTGHRPSPVVGLNRGFEIATGDILGWISSDDILLPNSLFSVAKAFVDVPEAQWITGMASTINERDEIVNCQARRKHRYDYLAGRWQVIQQESTFFRKSLWDQAGAGFDEDFLQAFDTELWTRFFDNAELYHLAGPVGAFRRGQQSRSIRNFNEFRGYNEKALAKMTTRASEDDIRTARAWRRLGSNLPRRLLAALPESWLLSLFPRLSEPTLHYSFERDCWTPARSSSFKRTIM